LLGHAVGQVFVGLAVKGRWLNLCPGYVGVGVEVAQFQASQQYTLEAFVDVGFLDQPFFNPFRQGFVGVVFPDTFHVGAGQHALGGCVHRGG